LAGEPRPDVARFLNVRRVTAASLSPDGRQVAYVTDTTGVPQVWVTDQESGAPHQLTFLEGDVSPFGTLEWSPTGEWIAYGADTAGDERQGYYLISADGLQERELLAPSAAFRLWGGWFPDGRRVAFASTERNGLDFDIYVQEVAQDGNGGTPRRVLERKGALLVAAWRPDGGALVLTEARGGPPPFWWTSS
jgi:Tol biopolymer transport system component